MAKFKGFNVPKPKNPKPFKIKYKHNYSLHTDEQVVNHDNIDLAIAQFCMWKNMEHYSIMEVSPV